MKLSWCLCVLVVSPCLAQTRTFSIANRLTLPLTSDWTERQDIHPPPHPLLVTSAPRLVFSDFLALENPKETALLRLGFSDNPFYGSNSALLDGQIHQSLQRYLFYFFFPPPQNCLARARSAWAEAVRRRQEEQEEEDRRKRKENESPGKLPPPSPASLLCDFGPTMAEFFSQKLSLGVTFGDRVDGRFSQFYLPPMEQLEFDGQTWFIFEAQSPQLVDRSELDQFGLAEELRGSKVHYFWAFGARSPFPFLRDPQRKDLQLIHLAAAMVSANGDAAGRFRKVLQQVTGIR